MEDNAFERIKEDMNSVETETPNEEPQNNENEDQTLICESNDHTCSQDQTLELFKMVFQAAQKPDENSVKMQKGLTITLIVVLCLQVVWALGVIIAIICLNSSITANALTFIPLLVTAILGEVVAMAFVVVRFVFRTPLDIMIELLKDIANKRK